jgi:hypothetical protein
MRSAVHRGCVSAANGTTRPEKVIFSSDKCVRGIRGNSTRSRRHCALLGDKREDSALAPRPNEVSDRTVEILKRSSGLRRQMGPARGTSPAVPGAAGCSVVSLALGTWDALERLPSKGLPFPAGNAARLRERMPVSYFRAQGIGAGVAGLARRCQGQARATKFRDAVMRRQFSRGTLVQSSCRYRHSF